MRILLTGATGFVGSNLLDFLGSHEVFCLVRNAEKYERFKKANTAPVLGDLCGKLPKLPEVDVIVHNAGLVRGAKKEYYEVNTEGTARILEKAGKMKSLKKFVFISSQAAAGPAVDGRPRKESDTERPVSDYGKSKLLAEKKVSGSGIPYIILRPSAVYGPGDRDIYEVFKMVKKGLVFMPGFGTRTANFINVLDAAGGIVRAAVSDVVNGTFFLVNPQPLSYEQFARTVAEKMDRKIKIVRVPSAAAYAAGFFAEAAASLSGRAALINTQKIRELTAGDWLADPSDMLSILGYAPVYDISAGVSLTVEWYRAHGWL